VLFIARNKGELSPALPNNIKYIVPILVTPGTEYLWEKSKTCYLDEKFQVPRIMSAPELLEFLKNFKSFDLQDSAYNWTI